MPFIDKAFKAIEGHPERLLRKALSYNLVDPKNQLKNVLGLGGVGAATGAGIGLTNDNATLKSVLTDAGIGAGVGGIGGKFLPRALQKGIGRVMTNLMDPIDYTVEAHTQKLKGKSFKELVNAVVKDKPITGEMIGEAKGRSHHFRKFFGLEPLPGTSEYFTPGSKPGEFMMNPHNADAAVDLATIEGKRIEPFRGKPQFEATNKPQFMETGHMGGFHVNPDGSYQDTWDFALHPHEKIDSLKNLFRAMVTPFGNPVKTVGKTLSEAEAHSKASLMDELLAKAEKLKTKIRKEVPKPSKKAPAKPIVNRRGEAVKSSDPVSIVNSKGEAVSSETANTLVGSDRKPITSANVNVILNPEGKPATTADKVILNPEGKPATTSDTAGIVNHKKEPLKAVASPVAPMDVPDNEDFMGRLARLAREAKASNADDGMIKAATPASLIAWKKLLFGNHVKPQLPLPLFQDVIQSGGVPETDATLKQASFSVLGKLLASGVGGSMSSALEMYRKFRLAEAASKLSVNPLLSRRQAIKDTGMAGVRLAMPGIERSVMGDGAAAVAKPFSPLGQMSLPEAGIRAALPTPVSRRNFLTSAVRGLLNPDIREGVGQAGSVAKGVMELPHAF